MERQDRHVDETQELVVQAVLPNMPDGLDEPDRKFNPISVYTARAVQAPFEGKACVSAGASKENTEADVAAAAPLTVAVTCSRRTAAPEARHRASDVEVQDTVVHGIVPMCTLTVVSSAQRFMPVNVVEVPPEVDFCSLIQVKLWGYPS